MLVSNHDSSPKTLFPSFLPTFSIIHNTLVSKCIPLVSNVISPYTFLRYDCFVYLCSEWMIAIPVALSQTLCPPHRTSLLRTLLQKTQRNSRAAPPHCALPPAHVNFTILVLIISQVPPGDKSGRPNIFLCFWFPALWSSEIPSKFWDVFHSTAFLLRQH